MTIDDSKNYFTETQQRAVIDYKRENDYSMRNMIYNKYLHKPFKYMVEAILRRYPIHMGRYTQDELTTMCLTHLIEKFERFDEWKPDKLDLSDFKFENPYTTKIEIVTNHYGNIISAKSDCKDFNDFMQKIVGKETIYINETIVANAVFKDMGKKKVTHFYYYDTERNFKYLRDYYYMVAPDIEPKDLENRIGILKYGIFIPLKEERKAFSYCQTIVRNFYKTHSRETYEHKYQNLEMGFMEMNEEDGEYVMDMVDDRDENSGAHEIFDEIFNAVIERIEFEINNNEFLSKEDTDLGNVLIDVLANHNSIFQNGEPLKKTFIKMAKNVIDPKKGYPKSMKRYMNIYNEVRDEVFSKHNFLPNRKIKGKK
jgi:hypothetical protein